MNGVLSDGFPLLQKIIQLLRVWSSDLLLIQTVDFKGQITDQFIPAVQLALEHGDPLSQCSDLLRILVLWSKLLWLRPIGQINPQAFVLPPQIVHLGSNLSQNLLLKCRRLGCPWLLRLRKLLKRRPIDYCIRSQLLLIHLRMCLRLQLLWNIVHFLLKLIVWLNLMF